MSSNKEKFYVVIPVGEKEYRLKNDTLCVVLSIPYVGEDKKTKEDKIQYRDTYHPTITAALKHIMKIEERDIGDFSSLCEKWEQTLKSIESFSEKFPKHRDEFFKKDV